MCCWLLCWQVSDVNGVVERLLLFLDSSYSHIVAETLVQLKDLLRRYPDLGAVRAGGAGWEVLCHLGRMGFATGEPPGPRAAWELAAAGQGCLLWMGGRKSMRGVTGRGLALWHEQWLGRVLASRLAYLPGMMLVTHLDAGCRQGSAGQCRAAQGSCRAAARQRSAVPGGAQPCWDPCCDLPLCAAPPHPTPPRPPGVHHW